jgi:ankyrin repeat protein
MLGWSQKEKDYALYQAIDEFSREALEKAIKSGANVNNERYRSGAPLFKAVGMYNQDQILAATSMLLTAGASPNMFDRERTQSVMHAAADSTRGGVALMSALVEAGGDIHLPDHHGSVPLFNAIRRKSWDVATMLVDKGGHKVHTNNYNLTIAAQAIEHDAPPALLSRLFETGLDVNAASYNNPPPLLMAAKKGNAAYINILLKQPGILPDLRDSDGVTALLHAVISGRQDAVAALLAGKAAPDAATSKGMTPLSYAAHAAHQEILEMLVKAGASLDIPGSDGKTALAYAAGNGSIRMVMTLLNAAQEQGVTLDLSPALHVAAEKGFGRVLELLIKAGADVNAPDNNSRTPLMKAATSDNTESIEILIKAGARPETADTHGMSAYDHAVAGGKTKAKSFLGKYRADVAMREQKGAAPADDYSFVRVNDHSLEVREGDGLTMTFNFWTQQIIFRDTERPAPVTIQNFDDVQRQESIVEAFEKLKSLGGTPPEPRATTLQKRPAALRG